MSEIEIETTSDDRHELICCGGLIGKIEKTKHNSMWRVVWYLPDGYTAHWEPSLFKAKKYVREKGHLHLHEVKMHDLDKALPDYLDKLAERKSMLVLSRKENEAVQIRDKTGKMILEVLVVRYRGNKVRLGFHDPAGDKLILRKETVKKRQSSVTTAHAEDARDA